MPTIVYFLSTISIFLLFTAQPGNTQFPTACMSNATLPDARCCPIPPGTTEPCGGGQRGSCSFLYQRFTDTDNVTRVSQELPKEIWNDDRINWPNRFFMYACQCTGNFWGPACDQCKPGYRGADCKTKQPRVRRNVMKLTVDEQRQLRDIVNASKFTVSEWSVLNVANNETSDPTTLENMRYYEANVYDFLVYVHFYAARSTMVDLDMERCDKDIHKLDYAHRGPAFLAWHRYYLILAEQEFVKIAESQFNITDFSLPYWDWTNKTECEICTDDLFGRITPRQNGTAVNEGDNGQLDPDCTFAKWRPLCPQRASSHDCHICDLEAREFDDFEGLWEEEPLKRCYSEIPYYQRLPSQDDVDVVMSAPQFDSAPFNESAANSSFRNCLEGFVPLNGFSRPSMHNLVHSFINGTWFDAATSPNDPIFFLHHAFVDKLYDLWLRSKTYYPRQLPFDGVKYGHHPNDNMVPFFPPVPTMNYHKTSNQLGYSYDDNLAGATVIKAPFPGNALSSDNQKEKASSGNGAVLTIVIAVESCIILIVLVGLLLRWQRRNRPYQYREVNAPPPSNYKRLGDFESSTEKTPLLSHN